MLRKVVPPSETEGLDNFVEELNAFRYFLFFDLVLGETMSQQLRKYGADLPVALYDSNI